MTLSLGVNATALPPLSTPAPGGVGEELRCARILIIDDELANVRVLERLLQREGAENFRSTTDSRQAFGLFREFHPEIILLDLHMPVVDGFTLLRQFRETCPPETFLPIVVLTADATLATKLRTLESGATDFLTKPLDHAEVLLRMRNLLHTRRLHQALTEHAGDLEETVRSRTADLRQALRELQEMQDHMVQQERLSAFGTMAGGVAHDFNNALSLILGYSEILLADDGKLSARERQHFTRTIITAAKDSARMIERLREFYRPHDEKEVWEHVDFAQLVAEAVSLTEPKWKGQAAQRGVALEVRVEAEPVPVVGGNAAELREALTNLIFNAVDAMPTGGVISLRTRAEEGQVVVEVEDTGTGMSEEVRRRCLEPFFTTKGEKGTGLGLAMVYGIAQRHGAALQLESEPGRGTTFRFRFKAEALSPEMDAAAPVTLAHALRVVVLDDQPFICEIMEQYLAQDGHHAESFSSGQEALARLRESPFDLVITDQAMPDLPGGQFALQARAIDPQLRIILLTGFGRDERPAEGAEAIDLVVGKPVTLEALRHAIAETMLLPRREAASLPALAA